MSPQMVEFISISGNRQKKLMRERQFGTLRGTVYSVGAGFTYGLKKKFSRECVIIVVAEWVDTGESADGFAETLGKIIR